MILAELRDYVQRNRVVSIAGLIAHFDMDPNTLREMLEVWIRKGKIRKVQVDDCSSSPIMCQKCLQCHMQSAELYEWITYSKKDLIVR